MADEIVDNGLPIKEVGTNVLKPSKSWFSGLPDMDTSDDSKVEAEAKEDGLFGRIEDTKEKLESELNPKEEEESELEDTEEASTEEASGDEEVDSDESDVSTEEEGLESAEGEPEDDEVEEDKEEPDDDHAREITALVNGREIKVKSNVKFKQKVNGEIKEFALEDLLQNAASTGANTKKFQDLQQKEKDLDTLEEKLLERDEFVSVNEKNLQTTLDKFVKLVNDGQAIQAVTHLLSTVTDPYPIVKAFRAELVANAQGYLELSPEERARLDAVEEAEYYKYKHKRDGDIRTETARREQLGKDLDILRQKYSLTKKALNQYNLELGKLKEEGKLEVAEITPKVLEDYHKHIVRTRLIVDTVHKVSPKLLQDTEYMQSLYRVVHLQNPSAEKLEEWVRDSKEGSTSSKEVDSRQSKKGALSSKPSIKPTAKKPTEDHNKKKLEGPGRRFKFSFEKKA